MENIGPKIQKKRKSLKISVVALSQLLNVNSESIYKWEKGTKPNGIDNSQKLEKFLSGFFDKYVIDGKLVAGYDYDDVIKENYRRTPTNDFHSPQQKNTYMEKQLQQKDELIESLLETIAQLRKQIGGSGGKAKAS